MTATANIAPPPPALPSWVVNRLRPGMIAQCRLAGTGVWTVLPTSAPTAAFDRFAALYDWAVNNWFYDRIIWGAPPEDFTALTESGLDALLPALRGDGDAPGVLLDAGAGSALFTAAWYRRHPGVRAVLFDRSLAMLLRARDRLVDAHGELPPNLVLLQGDVFDLPFADASCDAVTAWGFLHMFDDLAALLASLQRVARADAPLTGTALVQGRWLANFGLWALWRRGECGRGRDVAAYRDAFSALGRTVTVAHAGSMARLHGAPTPG